MLQKVQINGPGDATYKVCQRAVDIVLYRRQFNSDINNPVCWGVTPEIESEELITGTWRANHPAVFIIIRLHAHEAHQAIHDPRCPAYSYITDLMATDFVEQFMEKIKLEEGLSDVDTTLSDCSKGWTTYSLSEFVGISSQCV